MSNKNNKNMNQNPSTLLRTKGFAPIVIILIIAGVLIIGGGAWYWQNQKGKPVAEQPVTSTPNNPSASTPTSTNQPSITGINPSQGSAKTVNTITIYGKNFTGATEVDFYNVNNLVVGAVMSRNVAGDNTPNKDFSVSSDGSSLQFVLKGVGGNYFVGALQVRVVTPSGTSNAWPFTIITSTTTQPSITVLSPNGGENIVQGVGITISWASNNVPSGSSVSLYLQPEVVSSGSASLSPGSCGNASYQTTTGKLFWDGKTACDSNQNSVSISTGRFSILAQLRSGNQQILTLDTSNAPFSIVAAGTLSITTGSLPSGTVGVAYNASVSATGGAAGIGTYVWSATGLPAGLSIGSGYYACSDPSALCKGSGTISGIPTTAGTYTVNITLTSGAQSVSKQFSLVIAAAPSITVLSPNGGENIQQGFPYTIKWTTSNFGNLNVELDLTNTSGYMEIAKNIITNIPNTGSYIWTPDTTITPGSYKILISSFSKDFSAQDYSDAPFSIVAAGT